MNHFRIQHSNIIWMCRVDTLEYGQLGYYIVFFFPWNMFSHSSEVRVEGLETLDYLDNLQSKIRCTEQGDAVVFESEVSFVYVT